MRCLFTTMLILLSAPLSLSAQGADATISAEDKKELIRQMLEREITRVKEVGGFKRSDGSLTINLSLKNIGPELVPEIEGVKFDLLRPDEAAARGRSPAGFRYLAFDKFEERDSVVTVTLSNNYRKGLGRAFVHVKTFTYEYRKVDGKWAGKLIKEGGLIS